MKNLSIEEKAKRYDEVIEKLRSLHDNYDTVSTLIDIKKELEEMFPELEESEDERIRKQIISFLKEFEHDHYRCLDFSSWIAWLEKQYEQSSNILWHDVSEEPENNREIFCKWKGSEDNTWHDVVFYRTNDKTFWSGGKNQIKHVIEWAYVDEMLEKQGNNADKVKQQTIEIPFGAKDSELQEATYHIPEGYHAEINGNEVVIKKGEHKNTWKPTEEQIKALEHYVATIQESEYSYFHEDNAKLLHSLLEQLKKL